MPDTRTQRPDLSISLKGAARQARWTLALCLLLSALALAAPHRFIAIGIYAASVTLLVLGAMVWFHSCRIARKKTSDLAVIKGFIRQDATPTFVVNADGQIRSANPAAQQQFDIHGFSTLAGILKTSVANPGSILFRLQTRAVANGAAQEDVFTRAGHLRVCVHSVAEDAYVWRIDQVIERAAPRAAQDSQQLPMLMVGRTDAVLFMNDAARRLIGSRIKGLDRLFNTLPVLPGLPTEVATSDGVKRVLVAEVPAGAGRRALYLLPAPEQAVEAEDWHAFEDLPVPLIKVAPDGKVQSFNRTAAKLVGVALEDNVHLSSLMEGLGRSITDWINDTLAYRKVQKSEFLRLKRTDKEVFVQVVLSHIVNDGAPSLIAVLHDATELKALEAQFVQSQKMQAIGQLAGGVAHDFNNLLTAISGHCDLLLLRRDQSDPDYGDLIQINQNANRAASLVGQLLAFSRKQTLRLETIDMRDTLADLTHLLNRLVGEKVTLTLKHDPVLKPVRADKRQLEQVLMNLVVNARDSMPAGGEIRVTTELLELKEPLERDRASVPPGQYVTVQVSDDGAGIAPDKLQKVFEPFYTTKRTGEGTGLGLSTAYGIIKQSNGYIFVDSMVDRGTTFTLYLPVYVTRPVKTKTLAAPLVQQPQQSEEGVILLVEDEAPVRAFASRALRLRGYTVLEADSAETALKTLEDQSLSVDVFVTDVVMPGMDGPSWVREALKIRPDVPVVFVSGYAEDSFGEEQTRIPNSVFLPKPFSLSDLTETVQNQLH
ncbi:MULTISPECIES: ATP-binding protein [unclassified Sulfitobacter]|uniref:hybrid sensor histidine kinase/response regulator n=1 Tax=unclassified Sulfitobacter TaxID=196795 RepID=UPI0023E1B6F4|nr:MULTISPECIES: ATP-binding protein [unclassified Sulfitobacter]